MKTRSDILSEVLRLNREMEELQSKINLFYKAATEIKDEDDDAEKKDSYLACIKSYTDF